jgi:hypothetical protein
MRIYSDIDEDRQLVTVTFHGRVTLYDIVEMVSTSGKARVLHFPLLADVRKADVALDEADLNRFEELIRGLADQSRLGQTAVVLEKANDLPIIERLAAIAADWCNIRGFLDRAEAEEWLDQHLPARLPSPRAP